MYEIWAVLFGQPDFICLISLLPVCSLHNLDSPNDNQYLRTIDLCDAFEEIDGLLHSCDI